MNSVKDRRGPGIIRRLLVIIYDVLLLAGVMFACWALLWLVLLAVPDTIESHPLLVFTKQCYLVAVTFLFYGWFWVNGGQTLGMRAWRLGLVTSHGEAVTWRHATVRYLAAILSWAVAGIGFMWVLIDRRNRTWHGMLSETQIVLLPKSESVNATQHEHADDEHTNGR